MRKPLTTAALAIAVAAMPFTSVAEARGAPQRGNKVPPGLAKKLTNPTPGFLRAVIATIGSNSRLQDLPVSP